MYRIKQIIKLYQNLNSNNNNNNCYLFTFLNENKRQEKCINCVTNRQKLHLN